MNHENLDNLTYSVIDRIAKSRSINGSFAYYQKTDVYQEVWCMCLEAMDRYDATIGPVENYLVRHVTNRLKNLKRDRYFRPGSDVFTSGLARTRMNLVNALPIECGNISGNGVVLCGSLSNGDPLEYMLCDETLIYIIDKLPESMVHSFEDIIGNNKVRGPVVDTIRQKVAEILSERDNDVGC